MTHEEIESREIAEAYLRGRLSEPERAAFEDHCFACDQCFEDLRMLQKFAEGVRDAAETGVLPQPREAAQVRPFRLAFLVACAASLILAMLAGWIALVERPRLQTEAAWERREAEAGQKRAAELEGDLARMKLAMASVPEAQSNLPLVMLEASRAGSGTAVKLPAAARQLVIWVEPPPSAANSTYRLEISGPAGQPAETIDGLARNSYGALAASIPSARLTPGAYRARLYLSKSAQTELAGDYRFEVRR